MNVGPLAQLAHLIAHSHWRQWSPVVASQSDLRSISHKVQISHVLQVLKFCTFTHVDVSTAATGATGEID